MQKPDRIAEIVGEWRAQGDRGRRPDPAEVIRRHPELASELRARFEAIEELEQRFPSPPRQIGEFRILREIGRGGMGVVYEAEQASMRRRVALKVLFPSIESSPNALRRFRQEAQAAGRLKHTNIVAVHQLGRENGTWFSAMELVEGRPLCDVIADMRRELGPSRGPRRGPRRPHRRAPRTTSTFTGSASGTRTHYLEVARMFAAVADGLQVAHDHGVLHRDVKPGNLLLDAEGTLRIVDFGLARLDDTPAMTMTGEIIGTPYYMSPEQILGKGRRLDGRTDVYSLGVTMYEALTLRPPFSGESIQDLGIKILELDPVPPRRLDPSIPRDLETIVLKAMEKAPDRRYASAGELGRDLRHFAEGGAIRARRIGPAGRAWRKVSRHRMRSALAASLLLVAAAAVYFSVRSGEEQARIREQHYFALLAKAEDARGIEDVGIHYYDRAIALLPGRPEAYLGRAFRPLRSPDDRLADLDAAGARGMDPAVVLLARATVLQGLGKPEESEKARKEAVRIGSKTPEFACLEGMLASARGEYDRSLDRLDAALAQAGADTWIRRTALEQRSTVRETLGDYEGALADLEATGDKSLPILVRIAHLWRRNGHPQRAERLFSGLLARCHTEGQESWWLVCSHASQLQEVDWVERACEEAERAGVGSPLLRRYHALALDQKERHAEALKLLDGTKQDHLAPEIRHQLLEERATALLGLGRLDEASQSIDQALALENCPTSHLVRGLILEALGRYGEAVEALRRSGALRPSAEACNDLSKALIDLGRNDEALQTIEWACKYWPMRAELHAARSVCLGNLGRYEEALQAANHAVSLDASLASAHRARAVALNGLQRFSDALEACDRAAKLDAKLPDLWAVRASALEGLGLLSEALQAQEKAVEERPRSAEHLAGEAELLCRLGKLDSAFEAAKHAVALDGKDALAQYALAFACRLLGRFVEARRAIDRSLKLRKDDPYVFFEKARLLGDEGDWDGAIAVARQALVVGRDLPGAHESLVDLLGRAGKKEVALDAARKAVIRFPQNARLRHTLASALAALEKYDDAVTAEKKALDLGLHGLEWAGRYDLSTYLRLDGRLPEALQAADEAVRLRPDEPGSQASRGFALYAMRDLEKAREAFERTIALWKRDPGSCTAETMWMAFECHCGVLYGLGDFQRMLEVARLMDQQKPGDADAASAAALAYIGLGDYVRAEVEARRALEKDPDLEGALESLGICCKHNGMWKEALQAFDRCVQLKPANLAMLQYRRAEVFFGMGKYEEVLAATKTAISLGLKGALPYNLRGGAFQRLREYDKEVEVLETAVRLEPKVEGNWENLAWARFYAGALPGAVQAAEEAIRLGGTSRAWYAKAISLSRQQKLDQSIPAWDHVVKLDPNVADAWDRRAVDLNNLGRYEEARRSAEKAIQLDGTEPDYRRVRAFALMGLGRYADALKETDQVIAQDPKNGGAWSNRGQILWCLGRFEEAISSDERSYDLQPDWMTGALLSLDLSNAPPLLRDPPRALTLARQAVGKIGMDLTWCALGAALLRTEDLKGAVANLTRAVAAGTDDGNQIDASFLLAVAREELGQRAEARAAFYEGIALMEKRQPGDKGLSLIRAEAARKLGIHDD